MRFSRQSLLLAVSLLSMIAATAACDCPTGTRNTDGKCVDIDECIENTDNCGDNDVCINQDATQNTEPDAPLFTCFTCDVGFIPQNNVCTDVNECITDNPCRSDQFCINTLGSFQCDDISCPVGQAVSDDVNNAGVCIDIDECEADDDPCDTATSVCANLDSTQEEGTFTCECRNGFTKKDNDPTKCVDIRECDAANTNDCDAVTNVCNETAGSYTCTCSTGLVPDPNNAGNTGEAESIACLRLGSAPEVAAVSCKDILDQGASIGDGTYFIDPDRAGPVAPFRVTCDMSTEGGGWTEIAYSNDLPLAQHFSGGNEVEFVENPRPLDTPFTYTLSDEQISALQRVSTEGRQRYTAQCKGVVHYGADSDDDGLTDSFETAIRFVMFDGTEFAADRDTGVYGVLEVSVPLDECKSNEDNALLQTIFDLRSVRLPVRNIRIVDGAGAGEIFGSPLTQNPAFLR